MPNWCSNNFSLEGPVEKIQALWDAAKSNDSGLLEAMVPLGEWDYDKSVDSWGTKWDVNLEGLEFSTFLDGKMGSISGWFESAWSPPLAAFIAYCEKNEDVNLSVSYFEPGCAFVGRWNSDDKEDECYQIDPDNLDEIPDDLREDFDIDSWYEKEEVE